MFLNICGKENYKNLVVLTTFWDRVDVEEGLRREGQLKSRFVKDLIEGGAFLTRYKRTIQSAKRVLKHILTLTPTNLHIQKEICVDGKSLEDTAGGSVHHWYTDAVFGQQQFTEANPTTIILAPRR